MAPAELAGSSAVLGIDPGACGAAALIQVPPRGRAVWVRGWSLEQDDDDKQWELIRKMLLDVRIPPAGGGPSLTCVEVPGGGGKSKRGYGADAMLRLGERTGVLIGALRFGGFHTLRVTSAAWPQMIGLPVGKRADRAGAVVGWHRVAEARLWVEGFPVDPRVPAKTKAQADRDIALAEAALIALGGALLYRAGAR